MTRADIAVVAYTIAVNRGATTVDTIHVVLAVMQLYDNLIRDRITLDQVLAYVAPAHKLSSDEQLGYGGPLPKKNNVGVERR